MTNDEASYRSWARKTWRPGQPIKDGWPEWVKDEIHKIEQDRIVILEQETIRRIIGYATHQWQALHDLYRDLYPDERIQIAVFPRCNETTYLYIRKQFIALDEQYHPDVLPGMLWLNKGFQIDDRYRDWEVYLPVQDLPGAEGSPHAVPADCTAGDPVGAADA